MSSGPLSITIELRIDFDTAQKPVKEPIIIDKAKQLAKELITTAMLIQDRRPPTIRMQAGDTWFAEEEIKLVDDAD
jgi:hypothetical protein